MGAAVARARRAKRTRAPINRPHSKLQTGRVAPSLPRQDQGRQAIAATWYDSVAGARIPVPHRNSTPAPREDFTGRHAAEGDPEGTLAPRGAVAGRRPPEQY